MAIEHRFGMRETIQRRVCIYRPKTCAVFGRSLDVSSSGMYVDTTSSTRSLPINSRVQLLTVWREFGVFRIHRVDAVITRQDENGVGLMFSEFNRGGVRRLLALLRTARKGRTRVKRSPPPAWIRHLPMTGETK